MHIDGCGPNLCTSRSYKGHVVYFYILRTLQEQLQRPVCAVHLMQPLPNHFGLLYCVRFTHFCVWLNVLSVAEMLLEHLEFLTGYFMTDRFVICLQASRVHDVFTQPFLKDTRRAQETVTDATWHILVVCHWDTFSFFVCLLIALGIFVFNSWHSVFVKVR